MKLKQFKEIETIIKDIVCLATNCNMQTVSKDYDFWINDFYDKCAYYKFFYFIQDFKVIRTIKIDREFNISEIFDVDSNQSVNNQIEIFKLLKKNKFI